MPGRIMSELTASDSCPCTVAAYSTEAPPAGDSSTSFCVPANNSNPLPSPSNHLSSNNFLLQLIPPINTGGFQDEDSNQITAAASI